ncbi:hypothetical protein C0Z01_14515 [Photobacterium kishitanii]|uniref:hypothetical protein n=1 Tax=Photobacterium kishitanii TaxID=318456 RepID=UPI000D15BDAE|nr:hypothetical protein [Photobacterium kishitanii]PSW68622.1 hypothetical protein C0Z01_14515 [Photobacterium kishitanii]
METYPIIDISSQDIDDYEAMGTKSKFWYTDPADQIEYIFKSIHTEDKQGTPTIRDGEDWSEKIACEIASLLGIPHAHYELAVHNGERGTRSPNFTKPDENLVFGNHLLERIATTLATALEKGERCQRIELISIILDRIIVNPPCGWVSTTNIKDALDVFIGYLLLDTIISNQDRHSQNWAMIEDKKGNNYLSPSFDHGASLGRNESDKVRLERMQSKDIGRQVCTYVTKCKSHFYFNSKKQKTIDAFIMMGSNRPNAALEWLNRLSTLNPEDIVDIIDAIPSDIMSQPAKLFAIEMILVNMARLLTCKDIFIATIKKQESSS